MRYWSVVMVIAPLLTLACSADRLSGPEAQAAYAQARAHYPAFGEGVLVFVDGKRVPSAQGLAHVDPRQIRSIEIVKGHAAERLYGVEAKRGAIFIVTTSDSVGRPAR